MSVSRPVRPSTGLKIQEYFTLISACDRKNKILNAVATFPECIARVEADDPDLKGKMLDIFADFSPEVKALIGLTEKVLVSVLSSDTLECARTFVPPYSTTYYPIKPEDSYCVQLWRLYDVPTLETWSRSRATLIGDAAHPLQ